MTPAEFVAAQAAGMIERVLQQRVVGTCRVLGLRCYHTHDSRRSEPGFPDCVIAAPQGPIYAELKREKKRPTIDQIYWLDYFAGLGLPVYLWRPHHFIDGTIGMILDGTAVGEGVDDGRWIAGEGVRGDKWSTVAVKRGS